MDDAKAMAHKPTPEQKKRAVISAVVLAVVAIGIYGVVMLKFFVRG